MAATSQSSTQQVPMIDVWKSCTLCSAVVITSLRVLESNYSLFHKSQNHLIEFTVYFTKIRFGRTFPRKTRCSWRCLDVFIQSFRVDFLYEKCVERTVRKKHKKICDWFVMCCLCVTCTCDFFLIYICVIQNSTVSLHVFPYVLPCCLCELSLLPMVLCVRVFLEYFEFVSICLCDFCACSKFWASPFLICLYEMPIAPNTLGLFGDFNHFTIAKN